MSQRTPLECIALTSLRRMAGLSEIELADRVGISKSLMSRYESTLAPRPDLLDGILEVMGFQREDFEDQLSSLIRVETRRQEATRAAAPVDPTPEEASAIHAHALVVGREAEQRTRLRLTEALRSRNAAAARAEAETLCALLENDPKPWLAIEKVRGLQTWAVAERLAHRSAEVASDCIERARELAALAGRAAELAPCEGPFRESLLGYTLRFQENALRAAGDLPGAEALSECAEQHWQAGAAAPGPLQEWRLHSLAGSLHRDQQRFAESLADLDASLAAGPADAQGRLLVTKSLTLQHMGDAEQALRLLDPAEEAAVRAGDRRSALIARFNRARLLCRLGRYAQAELRLREIEAAADELGSGLNRIRLLWLRGSVAAGLDRREEAVTSLDAARRAFTGRKAAWEHALVALELVVFLCRTGRAHEIRRIARGLAWILEEKRLSRQARAALQLIREADEGAGVTLALAEQALQLLERAPKADAPEPPDRPEEQPGGDVDLSPFAAAGAAGSEPSAPLAGGGYDGAVAPTIGVDDAAPF